MNTNVHKKEISKTEMLYYLEEMIGMELASPLEENTYYKLMDDAYVSVDDLLHIGNTIQQWYQVKF